MIDSWTNIVKLCALWSMRLIVLAIIYCICHQVNRMQFVVAGI